MDQNPVTDRSQISAQIDDLRRMAELGDSLAIAGGQMCAWWGVVIAVGALLEAAVASGLLPSGLPVGLLMLAAGYGGTFAIPRLAPRSRFLKTWRTQAVSTAWVFAGLGILCINLGAQLNGAVPQAAVIACICVTFGILLAVMASSTRKPGLLWAATGWMVASVVVLAIRSKPAGLMVLAAAAAAFMLVPGLVVARTERRAQ